ncbi:MAG: AAA family ATPase [Verrucomicrobiota bacterium]
MNTLNDSVESSEDFISIASEASSVTSLPPIQTARELLAKEHAMPKELICGLLHQATKGVLAGSSKAGKTWLLLDMALSVASGTVFLKWPTKPARVLYVNLEIHPVFMKQRLETMMRCKQVNCDLDIWTLRGLTLDSAAMLNAIIERAQTGYGLIVVDPIYKLMVGRSENVASGVGVLCHSMERLMVETGAAVVYAHHFTKGNQSKKKAMDRMSGSGVFARDADTIVTVTECQTEGCFVVETKLRNLVEAEPFVVQWDYPMMKVRDDLSPELEAVNILDWLTEPLTTTEWETVALRNGISRATFYRMKAKVVSQLVLDGKKWKRRET